MYKAMLILLTTCFFMGCNMVEDKGEFEKIKEQLPEIGGFMINGKNMEIANWLGRPTSDGRELLEPINMIIIDQVSTSSEDSKSRLIKAFTQAGFPERSGHSSGYKGIMDGEYFSQTPSDIDIAFADFMWAFTNCHARFFGPYKTGNFWVWIGSSSQEKGVIHDYVSFKNSRNLMTENLITRTETVWLGDVPLNNEVNTSTQSTGDHDGFAKLLKLN